MNPIETVRRPGRLRRLATGSAALALIVPLGTFAVAGPAAAMVHPHQSHHGPHQQLVAVEAWPDTQRKAAAQGS